MLGVLPCGGEGNRWGGITKELIPIGKNRWLVDNAIDAMKCAGVNRICVVTVASKIQTLVKHFKKEKYADVEIFYVIQQNEESLWEALRESLPYADDVTLFAMTDTLFNVDAFSNLLSIDSQPCFALGTFYTQVPNRFGILLDGSVVDKPINLNPGNYLAWGTMVWSRRVVQEWLRHNPTDYTDAINKAIKLCGLRTFPLEYYYDFASWTDYESWMHQVGRRIQ